MYPSMTRMVNLKSELEECKKSLSELTHDKLQVETEMARIPDKQRSLNQIKKMRKLEDEMENIEREINQRKSDIRKLTRLINEV